MNADGSQVFVNYRRDDSAGYSGWLAYCLEERFGRSNVFRDVNTIGAGVDFMDQVARSLRQTDVMLCVIGPKWATITQSGATTPRLFEEGDYVRLELEQALKQRLQIVPVLVGEARMPSPTGLPDTIVDLAKLNAHQMRDGSWREDFTALAAVVEQFVAEKATGGRLTGREVLERHRSGVTVPTWIGRNGGLKGKEFAEDIATGRWQEQQYEVRFGGAAPSRNWFRVTDWVEAITRASTELPMRVSIPSHERLREVEDGEVG